METEFDFTKTNNKYIYKFNSNMAHIITLNHSLHFTDIMNIPEGIIIYSYDYENNKKSSSKPCR